MERRWRVNRHTGDPLGNSYTPPEGYYNESGRGVQARKELRLAEIERNISSRSKRRKAV
jgi:hypothetical protein